MIPLNILGIANGYRVDDIVWRGAQPEDAAWPLLAAAGCKRAIDLNSTRNQAQRQCGLATAAGIGYLAVQWNGILPPSVAQVQFVLGQMDGTGGEVIQRGAPVFVHCLHGSDRTGTLCACWRIHHDGWDFEDAMEEAFTALGLQGMHEFWMAAAVAEFAERKRQ
ncbi:MAG TPA: hypothetical protein VEL77_15175 [Rugosimonospora sp.]|nr:hypothetical protein [Rugosimonospora sp.]